MGRIFLTLGLLGLLGCGDQAGAPPSMKAGQPEIALRACGTSPVLTVTSASLGCRPQDLPSTGTVSVDSSVHVAAGPGCRCATYDGGGAGACLSAMINWSEVRAQCSVTGTGVCTDFATGQTPCTFSFTVDLGR